MQITNKDCIGHMCNPDADDSYFYFLESIKDEKIYYTHIEIRSRSFRMEKHNSVDYGAHDWATESYFGTSYEELINKERKTLEKLREMMDNFMKS